MTAKKAAASVEVPSYTGPTGGAKPDIPFDPFGGTAKIISKAAKSTSSTDAVYADLVHDLASAETDARSTSSDASEARGRRSTVAVATIRAVIREKINNEDLREDLITAGILKGTVSKIITIVTAVREKVIDIADVNSLNGAYVAVKAVRKAHADALAGISTTSPSGLATSAMPAPAAKTVTPDEALKIIIASITSEKDADKAFALGGVWITKITTAIGDALKAIDGDDDDE